MGGGAPGAAGERDKRVGGQEDGDKTDFDPRRLHLGVAHLESLRDGHVLRS